MLGIQQYPMSTCTKKNSQFFFSVMEQTSTGATCCCDTENWFLTFTLHLILSFELFVCIPHSDTAPLLNKASSEHMFDTMAMEISQLLAKVKVYKIRAFKPLHFFSTQRYQNFLPLSYILTDLHYTTELDLRFWAMLL